MADRCRQMGTATLACSLKRSREPSILAAGSLVRSSEAWEVSVGGLVGLLDFAKAHTPSRLLKNTLDFGYKGTVFEKKKPESQEEFWIETRRLPKLNAGRFFQRVEEVLGEIGFGEQVHRLCRPAYSQRADGRPGIDPVVYFKMLMVGFFENLPSERAIAARCEDSLAVRAFLGYGLEEATPDHSGLSVIRRRLPPRDLPSDL
jgi:hypothetical protein